MQVNINVPVSDFNRVQNPVVPLCFLNIDGQLIYIPYLYCSNISYNLAPSFSEATLEFDFGYIKHHDLPDFIKTNPLFINDREIAIFGYDGFNLVDLFIGVVNIENVDIYGDSGIITGKQTFTAMGPEFYLDRYYVEGSITENGFIEDIILFNSNPGSNNIFNLNYNKSSVDYEIENNVAPVFSKDGYRWSVLDIIRYINFYYLNDTLVITGQYNNLNNIFPDEYSIEGKSLFNILNELIDRRRGVGFNIYKDLNNIFYLNIFSTLVEDINVGYFVVEGNHNFTDIYNNTDAIETLNFSYDTLSQFNYISIQGGNIYTTATYSGADGSLVPDWTVAEETLYKKPPEDPELLTDQFDEYRRENLGHVYSRFKVNNQFYKYKFIYSIGLTDYINKNSGRVPTEKRHTDEQNDVVLEGETSSYTNMLSPRTGVNVKNFVGAVLEFVQEELYKEEDVETPVESPVYAFIDGGEWINLLPMVNKYNGWFSRQWRNNIFGDVLFERYIPFYNLDRSDSPDEEFMMPQLFVLTGENPLDPSDPTLKFKKIDSVDDIGFSSYTYNLLNNKLGFEVTSDVGHLLAKGIFNEDDADTEPTFVQPEFNWRDLYFTGTFRTQGKLRFDMYNLFNEQYIKKLIINIPDKIIHYVAPSTIIDIKNNKAVATEEMVVKNDMWDLIMHAYMCWAWYSNPRANVSMTTNNINLIQPGTFIRNLITSENVSYVNTYITRKTINFNNQSTEINTGYEDFYYLQNPATNQGSPTFNSGTGGGTFHVNRDPRQLNARFYNIPLDNKNISSNKNILHIADLKDELPNGDNLIGHLGYTKNDKNTYQNVEKVWNKTPSVYYSSQNTLNLALESVNNSNPGDFLILKYTEGEEQKHDTFIKVSNNPVKWQLLGLSNFDMDFNFPDFRIIDGKLYWFHNDIYYPISHFDYLYTNENPPG